MLTQAQEDVLGFIEEYIERMRFPPTREDIRRHFGWRSPNAAQEHLNAIERKGRIKVHKGIARGIVVL